MTLGSCEGHLGISECWQWLLGEKSHTADSPRELKCAGCSGKSVGTGAHLERAWEGSVVLMSDLGDQTHATHNGRSVDTCIQHISECSPSSRLSHFLRRMHFKLHFVYNSEEAAA
jgi:hypothetical protein